MHASMHAWRGVVLLMRMLMLTLTEQLQSLVVKEVVAIVQSHFFDVTHARFSSKAAFSRKAALPSLVAFFSRQHSPTSLFANLLFDIE